MIIAAQHKIEIPVGKILIIQLGDIGDVVWSIPAFWAVKNAFPQADVAVLTRKPNGDLLLDDPHIEAVFQTGKQTIWEELQLLITLRRKKFDLIFDLRADDRGAYTSFFIGARMRAGLYYAGLSWRNRLFTHLSDPPPVVEKINGAAEHSLRVIRGFGIKENTAVPHIFVSSATKNKMGRLLAAENIAYPDGYVTINPYSRWFYKEWGVDKWRALILFIWQKYKMPVLIMGSKEEKGRAEKLTVASHSPVFNLAGKTSLQEMAGLLQISRLHIGVDSAAPHIAAAVGTPTLTIYGPTDWRDWSPPGEKNKVVLTDRECSPCYKKGCDGSGRSECLENLTVAKVQDAVGKIMKDFVSDKS
jgi:ADP-heptose:LPS heptosyltransferase